MSPQLAQLIERLEACIRFSNARSEHLDSAKAAEILAPLVEALELQTRAAKTWSESAQAAYAKTEAAEAQIRTLREALTTAENDMAHARGLFREGQPHDAWNSLADGIARVRAALTTPPNAPKGTP